MSEDQPPVARMLDFSNVGFQSPPRDSLDNPESLPEQNTTRARTEFEFAIGAGPFAARAYNRERRRVLGIGQTNQYNGIGVSVAGRRTSLVAKTLFNPMTFDEFYAKPCPVGHTRIFRQLLEASHSSIQANLRVSKPFIELKEYIQSIPKEFSNLYVPTNFKFKHVKLTPNPYTMIWNKFIKIRFQLCRLVHIWLIRKSRKKMMPIPNYETMEDPKATNCIEWLDIPSRCSYRIHGDTLLKSLKMYLHHSEYGFPAPLWPKNPTTNAPFTQGQIQHIIYELYIWCGKNRKSVPYILPKFQAVNFCLKKLIVENCPDLTLYACRELFMEIHLPDAIEMWLDMVEEFGILYVGISRDDLEDELPRWILSLETEMSSAKKAAGLELITKWKSILPDLVQYSRFKYFNRSDWSDLSALKTIVKGLWANTHHRVKMYLSARKSALVRLLIPAVPAPVAADDAADDTADDASTETASTGSADTPMPDLAEEIVNHIIAHAPATNILQGNVHTDIIASFLNGVHSLDYRISSEWDNILDDTADRPTAVELEYNMLMFNSIVPPILAILPQQPLSTENGVSANAPVNPADSFDSVD